MNHNVYAAPLDKNYFNVTSFSALQKVFVRLFKKLIGNDVMHPDVLKPYGQGWVPPTTAELAEFKKAVGWSTGELAQLVDIDPKHLRNYLKERAYIQGKRIQYTAWRFWLESFGIVEPIKLEPLKPFLRSKIFSSDLANWEKPLIAEFRVIVTRSGYSDSAVARLLHLEEPLVAHLLHGTKADPKALLHVDHATWIKFLDKAEIPTLTAYIAPPALPAETLLALGDGFTPPDPKTLRQFIAWTGRKPEELAGYFGIEPSKMKFFTTNRSARTTDATIDLRVFGVADWRAPTFSELRTFMNILSLDPMEIAHRLKYSKQEMRVALLTRDNEDWKKQPLEIAQEDWFKLLDSLRIFDAGKIEKLTEREGRAYHIHYSTWRLMLYAFGIIKPTKLERKVAIDSE